MLQEGITLSVSRFYLNTWRLIKRDPSMTCTPPTATVRLAASTRYTGASTMVTLTCLLYLSRTPKWTSHRLSPSLTKLLYTLLQSKATIYSCTTLDSHNLSLSTKLIAKATLLCTMQFLMVKSRLLNICLVLNAILKLRTWTVRHLYTMLSSMDSWVFQRNYSSWELKEILWIIVKRLLRICSRSLKQLLNYPKLKWKNSTRFCRSQAIGDVLLVDYLFCLSKELDVLRFSSSSYSLLFTLLKCLSLNLSLTFGISWWQLSWLVSNSWCHSSSLQNMTQDSCKLLRKRPWKNYQSKLIILASV